jgi:hypothetical protein
MESVSGIFIASSSARSVAVHRIPAFRLRSQDQGAAEADVFELLRFNTVTADVGDPVFVPDEL